MIGIVGSLRDSAVTPPAPAVIRAGRQRVVTPASRHRHEANLACRPHRDAARRRFRTATRIPCQRRHPGAGQGQWLCQEDSMVTQANLDRVLMPPKK